MKDSLNFLLPIMEDETSVISNRNELGGLTNISSNGYYGYQPVVGKHIHSNEINRDQSMEVQMSDSDIQFNNLIPSEENNQNKQMMDYRGQLKRKRCWGYDYETEYPEFKKWRESDKLFNKEKSAHCDKPEVLKEEENCGKIVEDLLREIHGCSTYHWISENLAL